jgi:hypothetical protein
MDKLSDTPVHGLEAPTLQAITMKSHKARVCIADGPYDEQHNEDQYFHCEYYTDASHFY